MDGPRVSVAVTNYNGEAYLTECLAAIKAQTLPAAEILVVDNASTDGSLALLEKAHPDVQVVALSENRGPGVARNEAIRRARHRLLLSIDNDAILDPRCLERLVAAKVREAEASILEPRAVYHGDPTRIHYEGGYLNYLGIVSLRNHGERVDPEEARGEDNGLATAEVDVTMAVALLIDRDRLGAGDGYDEEYHFYFEDIDFSYRLRLKGHRVLVVPGAVVLHREGTRDLSYRKDRGYPARRAYYFTRNRWRFALKVLSLRSLFLGIPAALLYEVSYLLFVTLKGHLGSYGRGLVAVLRERKAILALRREIQENRTLSDRELLTGRQLTFVSTDDNRVAVRLFMRVLNGWVRFWWLIIRPLV